MKHNGKSKYLLFVIFIFMIISTAIYPADSVYAGGINGNESSVISAARGTFQYEGKVYVARQEHIQSLISRLSGDDVDLTAEQASGLISDMYGNIKAGVEEGYLTQISNADNQGDKSGNSDGKADKKNPADGKDDKGNQEGDTGKTNSTKTENAVYEVPAVIKETGFSYFTINTVILFILLSIVLFVSVIMSVILCKRSTERHTVPTGKRKEGDYE